MVEHFALFVAAVTLAGLAVLADTQNTTTKALTTTSKVTIRTTKPPITPMANGSYPPPPWYDNTDPWNSWMDPDEYPVICHTSPWARTNKDTPNDNPMGQICPCNYPYHPKQGMCCKPQGETEGPESTWRVRTPYFYSAAGSSVEAHISAVDGKLLCPCGYSLNATDSKCYTLKEYNKFEDRCPCSTTKSPTNGACYYNNATTSNGMILPNGTYIEQWGECLNNVFWPRMNPLDWYKTGGYLPVCPCEYVYNKKMEKCCKLKGARSPFFYEFGFEPADAWQTTTGGTQYCPCGFYQDDSDGYCRSIKPHKYEDRCPCGWFKESYRMVCFNNYFTTYSQPY